MGSRTEWDLAGTAVVAIECQNGTLGDDVAIPALRDAAGDLVDRIDEVLQAARAHGVRVVHAIYEGALGAANLGTEPLWRHIGPASANWTPGSLPTQVLPRLLDPADVVSPRHHGLSPVQGTELLPLLKNFGIHTVVLVGVSVNVAVLVTAAAAAGEGFHVVVARDAVRGVPPEYGEMVLENSIRQVARIARSTDLASQWQAAAANAQVAAR
ncbi:nicotinamidase-related amidase [Williamsia muralis]|uniref:Nicotinamidase-related amidase n=1 Tax=Williamsia marianensis TaxID=85044 RepID=A0A495K9N0_WILMA|nr:isochorismatase family protein [Williamsia muralis]RKR97515.1 nicotinamidase-related amidase [Williamsia muralis]